MNPSLRPALALAVPALLLAGCFNTDQPSGLGAQGAGTGVLTLETVEWGRLVDVLDVDGILVQRDVLIRGDVLADGVNYELTRNPVTEEENLQILQPRGSSAFDILLDAATSGLEKIQAKGGSDPPPYSMVPRNAAVRLTFSEQIAPSTVTPNSVQVLAGDPATQVVTVRYVVQNDARAGKGVLILDPTISARQSSSLGLPQNAVGFPESFDAVNDNLKIRIPTEIDTIFGQSDVLMNKAKTRFISEVEGEPQETSVSGDPVIVRVFRTGNDNDPYRGFLQDLGRPNLLGVLDITVSDIAAGPSADERDITYGIDADNCQDLTPKSGDVLEVGADVYLVSAVLSSVDPDNVQVRASVLEGEGTVTSSSQSGRLTTRYTTADASLQACFLQIAPTPGTLPASDVDPLTTTIQVQFDEPVDVRTVQSMHSFILAAVEDDTDPETGVYVPGSETVGQFIDRLRGYHNPADSIADNEEWGGRILFGDITVGNGSRSFTLNPVAGWTVPNNDADYSTQIYCVALRDGLDGILDLAGNPVAFAGFVAGTPSASDAGALISVDATQAEIRDKYFCLRGLGADENNDGLPEYGGQYDPNVLPGRITGRAPQRFSRQADSQNQYVGARVLVTGAAAPFEPLMPAGAVVMTLLRPHDLAFGYLDPTEFNLDVEGLSWTPLGGVVLDDTFDRFSIALAHANQHPDESLTITLTGVYPNSGLRTGGETFDENILGFPDHDEKIVFDTSYTLRAVNLFSADSGTTMLPWPDFEDTYTWRDTAIDQEFTGAAGGPGVPPIPYAAAEGVPILWPPEEAPSVGSPLLIRYRCYPRGAFLGTNTFQCTQMIPASTAPAFRIFSAGGRDAGGLWHQVIPDNAATGGTAPTGGFNVNTGQPTPNHDSFVYWTQADFVVRVSRVYTHWFAMGTSLTEGGILGMILEPENALQDEGTEVQIEIRGSTTVERSTNPATQPNPLDTTLNGVFDDYGDFVDPGNGSTVGNPGPWTRIEDASTLEEEVPAFEYFQLRFTFVSNADQNLQAFLDGFGFAWDFPEN